MVNRRAEGPSGSTELYAISTQLYASVDASQPDCIFNQLSKRLISRRACRREIEPILALGQRRPKLQKFRCQSQRAKNRPRRPKERILSGY